MSKSLNFNGYSLVVPQTHEEMMYSIRRGISEISLKHTKLLDKKRTLNAELDAELEAILKEKQELLQQRDMIEKGTRPNQLSDADKRRMLATVMAEPFLTDFGTHVVAAALEDYELGKAYVSKIGRDENRERFLEDVILDRFSGPFEMVFQKEEARGDPAPDPKAI